MRLGPSVFLLALLAGGWLAGVASAAEVVGSVRSVQTYGYGTPPQGSRAPKYPRDRVVADEYLETVSRGGMVVRFLDDTELTLGEEAQVSVDRFVFDPRTRTGEQAVSLSKGAFRFVTGRMSPEGIRIETPVATIGVRGTVVTGYHDEASNTTVISVLEGEATVTPKAGGQPILVQRGQAFSVERGGGRSQRIGHAVATGQGLVDRAPRAVAPPGQLSMRRAGGRPGERSFQRLDADSGSFGSSSDSFRSPFENNSSAAIYR